MRKSIACVFAAVLSLTGCSDDFQGGKPLTFGPDNPLDVSGTWSYEGKAVRNDCSTLFCSECHHGPSGNGEDIKWFDYIRGSRVIVQDREELLVVDHIISTAMGFAMLGSVRVYSGAFLCGQRVVDESGAAILYMEDGTFRSNDDYESTLSLTTSNSGTECTVIWAVTGRRAD